MDHDDNQSVTRERKVKRKLRTLQRLEAREKRVAENLTMQSDAPPPCHEPVRDNHAWYAVHGTALVIVV